MSEFEISVDDNTAPDYDISDNFAENLVDAIRSDMVANEQQFLALNAAYISGLSRNPDEYLQIIVRGKSGEGKTELKQNVDSLYPNHWLLRAGSTSDMGLVDAGEAWDGKYIGAFAEFQQMQGKMLEMVKSSSGDDADEDGVGFTHMRNVDDGDGGREMEEIERQSMPTVFLFADENNSEIPQELNTRQMTIRVESDEDINRAVAKTMFDHSSVEVRDREYEYNFNFEEGKEAIRHHIANIPKPLDSTWEGDPKDYSYPVVIPHDENIDWPIMSHPDIDTMGWDAFKVVEPVLSYKKTQSKRGARAIANHIRSHARLNHHNRETMDIGGVTHYVADPQDIANVLAYRPLLLAVTHDMNEQKLAVIEALTDEVNGVGAPGPNGGLQAPHKDIRAYIENHSDITSMSKHQLVDADDSVLNQMEQDYLIEVHEGEGEHGAHMYEFLGGSTFGHPNLGVYKDLFEHVTDPIRDQPIEKTVQEFEESLSITTSQDLMSEDPMDALGTASTDDDTDDDTEAESDDLSAFTDEEDTSGVEWDEVDERVHERLQDTVDDCRVTGDSALPHVAHMLGISPVEYETDDRSMQYVSMAEPYDDEHRNGTILDSAHEMWGDKSNGQVEDRVKHSIAKLREHEVFDVFEDEDKDGHRYMIVRELSEN